MAGLDRSMFRDRAIEKYFQRQERHSILRLVSPPVWIFLWILLLLFLGVAALSWYIQVPITTSGEGIVIEQATKNVQQKSETVILLLLPPDQAPVLHVGEPVNMTITSTMIGSSRSITLSSSIEQVAGGMMSPTTIRSQFNVPASLIANVTGPSAVALARVGPGANADLYLGSLGQVDVQTGSERVLSQVPGISSLLTP